MLTNFLRNLTSAWRGMNKREQRLALVVAALVLGMGGTMAVRGALDNLRQLDASIHSLQDSIVSYSRLMAMRQRVEEQYAAVAAQHSSEWTAAQIQDRLRQEIRRLAQNVPPGLNADGIPEQITNASGDLVEIPQIQEGHLLEGGEDYREFALGFSVPRAEFTNMVDFIQRLQESPQSLRIDALEINREPLTSTVTTSLSITRTITNGVKAIPLAEVEGAGAEGMTAAIDPEQWTCEGGTLEAAAGLVLPGTTALGGQAGEDAAQLYMVRMVSSGAAYDLYVDAVVSGTAQIGVSDLSGERFLEGAVALKSDGNPYRYHLRFTVPASSSGKTRMRVPSVLMAKAGTTVQLANVALREVSGL